ncbi:LytR C-terminal domain-containing protein [Saccharopolyspora halophila]|uniref:LytR C-terminal domain-containing protein n=1 Tax=Saccharopolyspora halophila TaxID=405551 RepID=A0ABN3FTK0_9PSEU
MSVGEPSGGPGRVKLLGFGLIGVGVVAAGIGAVTLWSDGPGSTAAAPSPETSQVGTPAPQSPTQQPPQTSVPAPPPPPEVTPPPRSSTEKPTQPPTTEQQVPGRGTSDRQIVVRVFNNSTISGLAHRAAQDFKRSGYRVPEEGNYALSRIPTTTFYYRAGTGEEKLAKEVAAYFGARAEPRIPQIEHFEDGIVAIVTNDYKGPSEVK